MQMHEYDGWFFIWHGGPYIDVFAPGRTPCDYPPGHEAEPVTCINVSGENLNPEDTDKFVQLCVDWAIEDAAEVAANN